MTTNMTIDQILWDLKYCDGEFPEAAFQAAREQRTEIVPRLIECIEEATRDADEFESVPTWGHVASLILLTEFEAREAFPAILKSMCSEAVEELYGDLITESFPQIAATLAADPEEFTDAIDDPGVNDYVRGSLLGAVFGMVCEERIAREVAVSFITDRLNEAVDGDDAHIVTKCAEVLGNLVAEEASVDVQTAEERELVNEEWIGKNYFAKQLARGQEAFTEAREEFVDRKKLTSVDMLSKLPWFNKKPTQAFDLEIVLREISEPFTEFPSDAVRWARKHREEITPHLIQILEDLPTFAAENEVDGNGHTIALFLLTEFGAREALPAILDLLNTTDSDVTDCLLDVMDGELAQMLGRLADSPDQLAVLIDNPELDDLIHEEAIGAVAWMVTENHLDRDSAITWLHERFETIRLTDAPERCADFAIALSELGATNSLDSVTDAIEAGEIDPEQILVDEVVEGLKYGLSSFEKTLKIHRRYRFEHTVIELNGWDWDSSDDDESDFYNDDDDDEPIGVSPAAIRAMIKSAGMGKTEADVQMVMKQLQRMDIKGFGTDVDSLDEDDDFSLDDEVAPVSTIRNTSRKVGRNDPCPCGSGRKYKKCCAKTE